MKNPLIESATFDKATRKVTLVMNDLPSEFSHMVKFEMKALARGVTPRQEGSSLIIEIGYDDIGETAKATARVMDHFFVMPDDTHLTFKDAPPERTIRYADKIKTLAILGEIAGLDLTDAQKASLNEAKNSIGKKGRIKS